MHVNRNKKVGKGTVSVWGNSKILETLSRQVLTDKIMTLGNRERRLEDLREEVMWAPRTRAFQ